MKLKLILTGGFVGKTITEEEDLTDYPLSFLQHLEKVFTDKSKRSQPTNKPTNLRRDQVQYFVEFKEQLLPLEELETDTEFTPVLKKLKERLHY